MASESYVKPSPGTSRNASFYVKNTKEGFLYSVAYGLFHTVIKHLALIMGLKMPFWRNPFRVCDG